jgi:hypothetical protein
VYKGEWDSGLKHGKGTFFFKKDKCTVLDCFFQLFVNCKCLLCSMKVFGKMEILFVEFGKLKMEAIMLVLIFVICFFIFLFIKTIVGKFSQQRPNIEGRYVTVNGNSVTGTFVEKTKFVDVPFYLFIYFFFNQTFFRLRERKKLEEKKKKKLLKPKNKSKSSKK